MVALDRNGRRRLGRRRLVSHGHAAQRVAVGSREAIHQCRSGVAQYRRRFNVAGWLRVESESLISNGPELLRSKTSPPHICFACWSLLHSAPADHPVVSANLELGLENSHTFFALALSLHSPSTINKPELQTIFLQSRLLGAARLSSNCLVSLISRWAHRRCCLPRRCAAPGECGRVKLFYLESRHKWTAGSCETLVFSYYQINQSCCLTRGNQLNDDGLVSLWKYQRTTIHPVGQEGTSGRKNDSTCTIRHQPKSFLWWTAIWLHSVLPAQGGLWHDRREPTLLTP